MFALYLVEALTKPILEQTEEQKVIDSFEDAHTSPNLITNLANEHKV